MQENTHYKEAEIEQRKQRIERIAESNEARSINGKSIVDMTEKEYIENVAGESYKPAVPIYNWLEN